MSEPLCEVCSRPLPDTAYVCSSCTKQPREDLALIASLAAEPAVTVARQSRHGDGGKASSWDPLPVDLVAARRAAAVESTVTTWARHVSETRGILVVDPPALIGPPCGQGWCRHDSCRAIRWPSPVTPMGTAARWLQGHLEWLRHRREAKEAFGDFRSAVSELQAITGGPLPRWYAGQCWEMVTDESGVQYRCEVDLYAAPGASTVKCPGCKTVHETAHRKAWLLDQAKDQLLHAEWIARALTALGVEDVTSSRIRGLAHRSRLEQKGVNAAGDPIYRVGDVLSLIEEQDSLAEGKRRMREVKAAKAEAKRAEKAAAEVGAA